MYAWNLSEKSIKVSLENYNRFIFETILQSVLAVSKVVIKAVIKLNNFFYPDFL